MQCAGLSGASPSETLTLGTGFHDPAEAVIQRLVLAEPLQPARRTVPLLAARPFRFSSGKLQGPAAEVAFVKASKQEKRMKGPLPGHCGENDATAET